MQPYANAQRITSSDADQVPLDVHFCTTSDPQTLAIFVGPQKCGYVRAAHAAKFQALDLNRRIIGDFNDIHAAMRACWGARCQ
jgi:hypothetical protein